MSPGGGALGRPPILPATVRSAAGTAAIVKGCAPASQIRANRVLILRASLISAKPFFRCASLAPLRRAR